MTEVQTGARGIKAGWRTVQFGDIAENVAVRVEPAEAQTDVYVGLEHLDPETLHLRNWGHPSDVTGQKLTFEKGDVIFGRRRAYQRKLAVAEVDGICSAHAMVVRAKPEIILPEFLPFFLQSDMFMERAIEISVGSLSPTINWKTLRTQEFLLPRIEEQKRIADILWAADEAVEAQAKVQSDAERLLSITLFERLNRSNECIRQLGSSAKIKHGFAFKSEHFSDATDMPLLLTPGNFTLRGELAFTQKNTKHYSGEYPGNFVLSRNDIVVVMTDLTPSAKLLGMPAFVREKKTVLHNQRIGKLLFDEDTILPDFLYFNLLNDGFRRQIRRTASGSTVKHTSPDRILSSTVCIPSRTRQEELLREFHQLGSAIRTAQVNKTNLKQLSFRLRESMIMDRYHV